MNISKFKFLFLFLFTTSMGYSQINKLVIKEINFPNSERNIYYADTVPKLVNGQPFTGSDTSVFFTHIPFDSPEIEKLLAIQTYKDGYIVDLKTFYDNGNQECHFQWKNGKRDGVSKRWYKSGKIEADNIKKNGETVGNSISYYENGNINTIIGEGHKFVIGFYENGKMQSLATYFNDSIKCKSQNAYEETQWDKNGQLQHKWIANCGKQPFKVYYNDSVIGIEGSFIGMPLFLVGKYKKWYPNGTLMEEREYLDGNTQNEANIKTGVWKYWTESGKLQKEEHYENDKLIKTKEYIKEEQPVIKINDKKG